MGEVALFPKLAPRQIGFDRLELAHILDLYGRMVSAGNWRDYSIRLGHETASFAVFRRTADRPEFLIEKRPALRFKQGQWTLFGEHGVVLRRGHELGPVLAPLERRLMKLVER